MGGMNNSLLCLILEAIFYPKSLIHDHPCDWLPVI